jgi:uncharacterized protein YkwD
MVYKSLRLPMQFERIGYLIRLMAFLGLTLLSIRPATAGPYLDFANELVSNPPAGSAFRPDLEDALFSLANRYRANEGKKPLASDPAFRIAARAHAADMMIHGFMGHKASTGHDFDSRMRVFVDDITRFPAMAENAARDTQKTPVDSAKARALFQQWVGSRTHRRALRSRDYQFVSTGVIQRGNSIWAVQIFFAPPRAKGLFQFQ